MGHGLKGYRGFGYSVWSMSFEKIRLDRFRDLGDLWVDLGIAGFADIGDDGGSARLFECQISNLDGSIFGSNQMIWSGVPNAGWTETETE